MKKQMPAAETRFQDLSGNISINLKEGTDFNELCAGLAGFNPERFEAVAVRVFIEKEIQLTVYAVDRSRQPANGAELPVHKFKLDQDYLKLKPMIGQINFTVTTGEYDLEKMDVINK